MQGKIKVLCFYTFFCLVPGFHPRTDSTKCRGDIVQVLKMVYIDFFYPFETGSDDAHHGATLNVFAIKELFLQMNCTETEKKKLNFNQSMMFFRQKNFFYKHCAVKYN